MQFCSAESGVQKLKGGAQPLCRPLGSCHHGSDQEWGLPVTVTFRMLSQAADFEIALDEQAAEDLCC